MAGYLKGCARTVVGERGRAESEGAVRRCEELAVEDDVEGLRLRPSSRSRMCPSDLVESELVSSVRRPVEEPVGAERYDDTDARFEAEPGKGEIGGDAGGSGNSSSGEGGCGGGESRSMQSECSLRKRARTPTMSFIDATPFPFVDTFVDAVGDEIDEIADGDDDGKGETPARPEGD